MDLLLSRLKVLMPPDPVESFLSSMNDMSPHAVALGIKIISLEPDAAVMMTPYKPELVGDPDTGVIAGGVLTTLMDHCGGQAAIRAIGRPTPVATLDLRIDYMRAAEPGRDIYARAHCYKVARSVAFVRASAYESDPNDPIATAQAVFMVMSRSPNKRAPTPAGKGSSQP